MNRDDIEQNLLSQKERLHDLDGYIEFEGHNCEPENGECKGWDMKDTRCQCGNRRVCWYIDDYSKKDEELTVDDVYARAF